MSRVGERLACVGVLLVVLALAIVARAQEESAEQHEGSPAKRHAQVVAHGVMTMPAGEVAWRLGTRQAQAAEKSSAEERGAGFVVAGGGELAVTDAAGLVVAWLGPGGAHWTDAGAERVVVSADRGRADYLEIALVPAREQGATDGMAITEAFAVPEGAAADVDLIRDVLRRGEESVIPASSAPMLLVVMSGKVFVDRGNGAIDEISAGAFVQVEGDVVVSGASRAPASFIVARIGAPTEERVSLREESGTPAAAILATPIATPVAEMPQQASVEIAASFCPVAYTKAEFAKVCREPASEIAFSVERRGKTVQSRLTDDEGQAIFAEVKAGEIAIAAGLPERVAFSEFNCRTRSGEWRGTSAENRIMLPLAAGDELGCDWYIVPANERLTQSSLSVAIRGCPEGMTATRFRPEACATMPPGTVLTLRDEATGKPLEVATSRPDRWRWDGLASGEYTLDVAALPAGYSDSALENVPCCGVEQDFTVAMPRERRKVTHTLYLFPLDVPRDRALTVFIRACPPGMTQETFVAGLCVPAPAGTMLTLSENGIDVGVAAAASDAWQWSALGALPYALRVHALPAGFTAFQVDDAAPFSEEDEISVDLATDPAQAEHTLFLFQPPIAGEESDVDGDGLLDADEVELGTQPFLPDSDVDGLRDGDEVGFYGTDPGNVDTDDDGLSDTEEVQTRGTNPLLADTDGDVVTDAAEIAAGSDPLDWTSVPATPTPTATPIPPATPLPVATPVP